jgi:hypothetical protein
MAMQINPLRKGFIDVKNPCLLAEFDLQAKEKISVSVIGPFERLKIIDTFFKDSSESK